MWGLSNVRLEELEAACEIVEVSSVQVALSPPDLTPLKNGVAEFCAEKGIALLAHSPLGGHRSQGKLERQTALRDVAERRSASVQEVALAWLLALHPNVIPIPGASRRASLESILAARPADSGGSRGARTSLSRREAPPRSAKSARSRLCRQTDAEIVLFVGYPGAGKSTLAADWIERGYELLNRDLEGGGLSKLREELDMW